jgi:peptidylprolyl isomerase
MFYTIEGSFFIKKSFIHFKDKGLNSKLRLVIRGAMLVYRILLCFMPCLLSAANTQDNVSQYSEYVGYTLGKELQILNLPYDVEAVARGLKKFKEGIKPNYIESVVDESEFILQLQGELFEKKAAENKKHTEEFFCSLCKNSRLITVVEKQLYYEIVKEDSGSSSVRADSKPLVHYAVYTFEDIKLADTFADGEPVRISLCEMVPGFSKAILGMKKDERRKIYVHPDLAYKRGGVVPPNSVLLFDVAIIQLDE